jgi:protein SCO1/2
MPRAIPSASRSSPLVARLLGLLVGLMVIGGWAAPRWVLAHSTGQDTKTAVDADGLGHIEVPEVSLQDQDGEPIEFYRDLVKGKVVVLSFIYTTCSTVCTPIGFQLAALQRMLKAEPDIDCEIVSISVDPVTDTPQRLKAWSRKFNPAPGWTFVTGSKPEVDRLLKALSVFVPDFADHSPVVLIGNDSSGQWTRASGLAPPGRLMEIVARVSQQ